MGVWIVPLASCQGKDELSSDLSPPLSLRCGLGGLSRTIKNKQGGVAITRFIVSLAPSHSYLSTRPHPTLNGARSSFNFGALLRHHADKAESAHHGGQLPSDHLEPNWLHRQTRLEPLLAMRT